MTTEQSSGEQQDNRKLKPDEAPSHPAVGSEASRKGGKENAQRQAERDWENSPKESGD